MSLMGKKGILIFFEAEVGPPKKFAIFFLNHAPLQVFVNGPLQNVFIFFFKANQKPLK